MRLYAGTSGFSYKAWKGHFYPEDLPAARMLEYYAEHLPAVEINSTFYRMPRESVLADWASRVPESFSFVLKASRRITHMKRLKDAGDEVAYLYGVAKKLGAHRGPLLFQTPPNLKKDLDRLRSFLAVLPDEHRAAFEFRHSSWFEDDVFEALREAGAALCAADTGGESDAPLVATGPFGYLRLRRDDYGETDLASWAQVCVHIPKHTCAKREVWHPMQLPLSLVFQTELLPCRRSICMGLL